jgi:MoaA/NifB/PqqE/SkfB family radical SAM enzyme
MLDESGRALNAQTHSIRDIWASGAFKDVRRRMAEGEKIPNCSNCWSRERFRAGESLRHHMNARWIDRPGLRATIDAAMSWDAPTDPQYLDLRLGNICNLKCTICKPLYSSQIERDPVHTAWLGLNGHFNRLDGRFRDEEWSSAPAVVDEVMDLSGSVTQIYLAGGEPTINRTQIGWLQRLAANGRAADIDLVISSNLIGVKPAYLDLLSQFKRVEIWASVDGYGPAYEYVRYPAKWRVLANNIAKTRDRLENLTMRVCFTLQAINLETLPETIDWCKREEIQMHLEIARGLETYNDIRILPPDFRAEQIALARGAAGNELQEERLRGCLSDAFAEIEADDYNDDTRHQAITGLMQFINDMDRSRSLSLKSVAPETWNAVAKYTGGWDERCRFVN